jgi:hypothetical protein
MIAQKNKGGVSHTAAPGLPPEGDNQCSPGGEQANYAQALVKRNWQK